MKSITFLVLAVGLLGCVTKKQYVKDRLNDADVLHWKMTLIDRKLEEIRMAQKVVVVVKDTDTLIQNDWPVYFQPKYYLERPPK